MCKEDSRFEVAEWVLRPNSSELNIISQHDGRIDQLGRCAESEDRAEQFEWEGGAAEWSGEEAELFDGLNQPDERVRHLLKLGDGTESELALSGCAGAGVAQIDVHHTDRDKPIVSGGE